MVTRPIDVTEALIANPAVTHAAVEWDADRAVTAIYSEHYRSLVRLAAFLVRDTSTAEEVVQDSFVAMHGAWRGLRDSDKALSYLRQSVVNRSRIRAAAPDGRGQERAEAAAGHAERRARRDHPRPSVPR